MAGVQGTPERRLEIEHPGRLGPSNREIANSLHLGVTMVKTHVTNLMRKTGCSNRIGSAVLAVQSGIASD
ncbi:response regulator transcription factor [Actinomadura sp. 9N215]|uniref:response regulator transcription factor n=1 Tax=Actinomadura sp. 9N215 TaxID=3375150 RepID=UPI0037960BEE